ncbi:MAG TPA: O-antigen ligase family protein [Candidatus Goldiibacteriota bacterium]|nr:O-antigen ligase family protein [Candidatus Goldiibacteriota bacterium]
MEKKQAQVLPNRIESLCDNAVFWLLAAALFIIPLFFNIKSYDQFEMPKLTVLRILTSLMLGLWLVKSINKGRFEWVSTPLDFPMLAWTGLNLLTTFTSLAPFLSFRGEYENFAGSLSNINYVILYFIASQFIRDKKQVFGLAYAILLSGLFTGIYSMMQFSGSDIIKWNAESMIKGRYFASMGNPNFLGALLIMIIPVNIAFITIAVREKKFLFSGLLFLLFILLYVSLFGTQSRGPFLGFAFSILAMLGYAALAGYRALKSGLPEGQNSPAEVLAAFLRKYSKWLLLLAGLLSISLILSLTLGRNATQRLWSSITNIRKSLQVSRLNIWVPALKMIRDYPLLGTGVDTFKTVFPKFSGTDFANIDGANVSSRTAHNEPLNIAATMGLPSLGVYFLLLWTYSRMWLRGFSRTQDFREKTMSLALYSAFIAYFVQNLFSFGVCAINTALYIFMAMHFALYRQHFGVQTHSLYFPDFIKNDATKGVLYTLAAASAVLLSSRAYTLYAADVAYNRVK